MINFTRIKRKIKIVKISVAKFFREFRHTLGYVNVKKTTQDLLLTKLVKSLIYRKDCKVIYSPNTSKVYVYTKNKDLVIIFDLYTITISNHKFFFNCHLKEGMGEEIVKMAKERIQEESNVIERMINQNQKDFLTFLYENTIDEKPTEDRSEKKFDIYQDLNDLY